MAQFLSVPLAAAHDLTTFECGAPVLNDWLIHRALKNEGRFSRTFVVCNSNRVIGYYCIAAGAVERDHAPGALRRNAPDPVPVSVIGRLAVCQSQSGKGLGSDLLADAFYRVAKAAEIIGIAAVVVQAKSDTARQFYLARAAFIEYPEDSRTLYLPIETVIAAL